jgi:hypothetical protein
MHFISAKTTLKQFYDLTFLNILSQVLKDDVGNFGGGYGLRSFCYWKLV